MVRRLGRRTFITLLGGLAATGCSSSRKKGKGIIKAPARMRPAIQGWKNTITKIIKDSGEPFSGWRTITVIEVPAAKRIRNIPVYWNGKRFVGGDEAGGRIRIAVEKDGYYDHQVLGHEIWHVAEAGMRDEGGHPGYIKDMGAPYWPTF